MEKLDEYQYNGASVLVSLHERELRGFYDAWKSFKKSGSNLPVTKDPNYKTCNTLLHHVLKCAKDYLVWICENLELPDPGVDPVPEVDSIDRNAENYIDHLLKQWENPLKEIPQKRFYVPEFRSMWKVNYCIDAMLEHAVMHPVRHKCQLA